MASLYGFVFFISYIVFFISPSTAETPPFKPKALVLPVSKDKCTLQYTTQINQRTPLVPVKLTVDLGGRFMWVDCQKGFASSSYKPVKCNSPICSLSNSQSCYSECHENPKSPGCLNSTCAHLPDNRIAYVSDTGEIRQDIVSLQSFDGKALGWNVSVPNFPFVCSPSSVLENLAAGVKGMAGLGRSNISLPAYFSPALGLTKKFAMCLSSSTSSNGAIFFGDGPNSILPNDLVYTPLIVNPDSTAASLYAGEPSADYYINLKSIRVDGKEIKLNKTLLPYPSTFEYGGKGGTRISTIHPYTVLHTSIYKALLKAFVKKAAQKFNLIVPHVPVPFEACYIGWLSGIQESFSQMPVIDLELEGENGKNVFWRISGANSMVAINSYTICFAFVDGGSDPQTPIIIGGRQLEDNYLQFDLANSRLGFSSNLLNRNTSCSKLV